MTNTIVYDSEVTLSSPLVRCPTCEQTSYYPGANKPESNHKQDCSDRASGKANLVTVVGLAFVSSLEQSANGDADWKGVGNISINMFKRDCPAAWQAYIQARQETQSE